MSLCLAGCHRSGKSTLAGAVAKRCESIGMVYVPSRASAVFKRMNFGVDQVLSFDERMGVQEAILDAHVEDITQVEDYWVSDRSTLDMAAYTLADWGKLAEGAAAQARLMRYVERCFEVANRYYSTIMLIQSSIPFVVAEGKPAPNLAYQEMLNAMMMGLLRDGRLNPPFYVLGRHVTDLQERVNIAVSAWNQVVINAARQQEACYIH